METCQALSGKYKESSQLLWSSKGGAHIRYIGEDAESCVSVQTVQLSAQKINTVVKTDWTHIQS